MAGRVLDVLTMENVKVDQVALPEGVFAVPPQAHLVHQMVRFQQNARRQGTASTKTRSEVSGGGRKPWRQKGTGRARAGTIRSPLWRHGGTVFGPKPRSYALALPRAVRRQAMRVALSAKAEAGAIRVLDGLSLEKPSTKAFRGVLQSLQVRGRALVILPQEDEVVMKSARNLPTVKVLPARGLNVYDILAADTLLFTRDALALVGEAWQ
ncbi:MAG TPA: 50S ribosomal protein L4 [Candidatus Methylomirabilis sp.]|jgi:large subunit ribosomal protein L4|nr:50S ribosomal protein L4 [Candidatus Methylomirabilis sp.]